MRFYRVHLYVTSDGSAGYSWFTTRREADAMAARWRRDNVEEGDHAEVEEININPTKVGILNALNQFASHNDNG